MTREPSDGVYISTPEDCPDRHENVIWKREYPELNFTGCFAEACPNIFCEWCLENNKCPRHYANPMGVYRE